MADNTILTDNVIAKEALMIVENNLTATKKIKRRYEKKFAQDGNKIGDTLNVRLPVRWEGREGELMTPEGAKERSVALKIDRLIGQDLEFSNVDLTLKVDQFRERYLDTACATIANKIDAAILSQYKNCPNFVGTPGTTPTALSTYIDAGVLLSNYAVPTGQGKRSMVLSPRMEGSIVNALTGLFQAAKSIAEQYETGGMGYVVGFDFLMDQNVQLHTVGPLGGTPLVNGSGQTGASIVTDGWTASAASRLNQGDIITFSSTDGVNPQSKDDIGDLRQFVVTSDQSSTSGGAVTIPIFPSIETGGAYRNVSAGPADNAVIKIFGHASSFASTASRQGMGFHPEWLTAAFVDLDLPKGMEMAARATSNKSGLSIRIIKGYDIRTNQQLCRLDVLFGLKQLYEDFAVRICAA